MQESTMWAVKNYNEWSKARNAMYAENPEEQVPEALLQSTDPTILSKWLGLFIAETRKQDGRLYPPKTLYLLLSGVYRYMKSLNPVAFSQTRVSCVAITSRCCQATT